MKIDVKVKLSKNAVMPKYQTEFSSGLDLVANENITLTPGQSHIFNTGISIEIPVGIEGQIRSRSGLSSKYGVIVVNGVGTIDSDYRGELKIPIINIGQQDYSIVKDDRIAQLIFAPIVTAKMILCDELSETVRGSGGLGSTGK